MEQDPFRNIERENIRILRERLGVIYGHPDYSTMGHGTNEETAKKILSEGISTKPGTTLKETVIPLFDSNKPYAEQPDTKFSKILHWPHKEYKHIVIVMIPNPRDRQSGGINYFNSALEEQEHREWGERNVIPPKFIKGYIDVNNLQFIENNLYDKNATIILKNSSVRQGPSVPSSDQDKPHIPSPSENDNENQEDVW